MVSKIKSFMIKAKDKVARFFGLWGACIAAQGTYHATDIGNAIDSVSSNVLDEIARVYCGSLFFLLLGVNIVVLAFSKNDKVLGVAKRTIIFIIAAYFVLKLLQGGSGGKIGTTVDTLTGWITG